MPRLTLALAQTSASALAAMQMSANRRKSAQISAKISHTTAEALAQKCP